MLTRSGYIDELTVTPKVFDPSEPERPFCVYEELDDGSIAVPRHWARDKFGHEDRFIGRVNCASGLVFKGNLKLGLQERVSMKCTEQLRDRGGGILCLPTGTGKTVIALHVACQLSVKTLVVVHKQFLVDQWTERIARFVPSAKVGRIQQKTADVHGCDIVIGMLQSIAMHHYGPDTFEGFGLVVFDEVHVVPAPVFSRALFKVCSPCMLGMSATPERKDGLSHVIGWFLGPLFVDCRLSGRTDVGVFAVPVMCDLGFVRGRSAMAGALTRLYNNAERNSRILQIVHDLAAAKRRVIVLSDRRSHCTELRDRLAIEGVSCALYIGGMKAEELKESEGKDVLLATYSMAKEGLDIPALDSLVLACPRSDVVQACGRILHGKSRKPVIVDIVDQWVIGKAQYAQRKAYYDRSGFTIM
jgi:superfamily II DNA or RNA helicase